MRLREIEMVEDSGGARVRREDLEITKRRQINSHSFERIFSLCYHRRGPDVPTIAGLRAEIYSSRST